MTNEGFSKANYTAVISDLHLCEAEPIHPKYPLWKKFKTKEFFIDETLIQFLSHIQETAVGNKVELILNGDIFDFDSVMSLPENPIYKVSWLESRRGLFPKQEKSLFKRLILVAPTTTRRKWQKALKGSNRATRGYPTFEKFLRRELKV